MTASYRAVLNLDVVVRREGAEQNNQDEAYDDGRKTDPRFVHARESF